MSGAEFNGRIDSVIVYDRGLTPAEVQEIYNYLGTIRCPECGKDYVPGHHPDNGCRMGVVDNVMES
ncbi:hypothetical protein LCGC14_2214350 [marine sediment metagenome]|uniref:LamG-like jellyroll fold domain-containing protein n=1 Tax=marine sediment metagenome TaxID=412755 RepID=A0A0F9DD11_9ZZZZ